MNLHDQYLTFVRWSEADNSYVGYCPDLFPTGGVCHGATSVEAFGKLAEIVEDTVSTAQQQGLELPAPRARHARGGDRQLSGSAGLPTGLHQTGGSAS